MSKRVFEFSPEHKVYADAKIKAPSDQRLLFWHMQKKQVFINVSFERNEFILVLRFVVFFHCILVLELQLSARAWFEIIFRNLLTVI